MRQGTHTHTHTLIVPDKSNLPPSSNRQQKTLKNNNKPQHTEREAHQLKDEVYIAPNLPTPAYWCRGADGQKREREENTYNVHSYIRADGNVIFQTFKFVEKNDSHSYTYIYARKTKIVGVKRKSKIKTQETGGHGAGKAGTKLWAKRGQCLGQLHAKGKLPAGAESGSSRTRRGGLCRGGQNSPADRQTERETPFRKNHPTNIKTRGGQPDGRRDRLRRRHRNEGQTAAGARRRRKR